jgi:hypothetical protein
MKSKDEMANDHGLGMSRRAILKAASAVAAAGITIGLPEAAGAAPTGPIDYGVGHNLGPANIYPLLAAWLIATTNGDQAGDFKIPESLGTVAGLGPTSYNYIFNTFFNDPSYRPAFTKVRTAFQLVATHFASYAPLNPITNPYGGGICPDKASVVQAVASLPCAVSPSRPAVKGGGQ